MSVDPDLAPFRSNPIGYRFCCNIYVSIGVLLIAALSRVPFLESEHCSEEQVE